ncbi:hypothetical protein SAMN05216207_1010115 [Pseudonocardia ammonioxydans]|uniref:Uncharacterized protein n=1 Tax=Pseudonocardia ammonioxydans TaxID=260086 RepID=A0A1I4X8F4_PSUAM|nr:hypothetical protein SAMN05216207_1010115 [Pseudonocardia ammonioxydans]
MCQPAPTNSRQGTTVDFTYTQDLVRALLRDQHPDLAALELRDVEGG